MTYRRAHPVLPRAPLLALALITACGGSGDPAEQRAKLAAKGEGDVVIGVAWPWAARTDVHYADGLDLATAEVNARGGVNGRRIRLLKVDDHESVNDGRLVAQKLTKDPQVVAVIGHLQSYVTVPAAAIYDLAGIVLVAPTATTPELTAHGYQRVFRTTFTDKEVGEHMARTAATRGYRRVAVYYIRNDYGRGLANAFEEQAKTSGIQVVDRQSYDPSTDLNEASSVATVTAWRDLQMDAVFVAGQVPQAGLFIAKLRKGGITVPVLGGDALGSAALMSVGGPAVEGATIAAAFHPDVPRAEVTRFRAAYMAKYGAAPDAGAALGYDAVQMLAEAMRRAKTSDPEKVAAALHTFSAWPGVTGAITFNEQGDLVKPFIAEVTVRGGRFAYSGGDTPAPATLATSTAR
jgi:branched-chain amino acid transport system substrate-binding protein